MIELLLNAESALALGLLDQAERIYHTVLEADPRNGIAAVGLSRVALERGDDASAHALARAALKIDPENATARRMIDRLEEVARYRDAAADAVPARRTGTNAPAAPRDSASAAPEPPDAGAASPAMIPAVAVTEAGADPGSDAIRLPVAPDAAESALEEASSAPVTPDPAGSDAGPGGSSAGLGGTAPRPGGAIAEPMHESSPDGRVSGPEPAPTAERVPGPNLLPTAERVPEPDPPPPPAAAPQAAPARPGLLRRILGRS